LPDFGRHVGSVLKKNNAKDEHESEKYEASKNDADDDNRTIQCTSSRWFGFPDFLL
jgi:hypothetical protein